MIQLAMFVFFVMGWLTVASWLAPYLGCALALCSVPILFFVVIVYELIKEAHDK